MRYAWKTDNNGGCCMLDPGLEPRPCLYMFKYVHKKAAQLPCWLPRGNKACKQGDPPWRWNPGQTSPEVQNKAINGPTKGLMYSKKLRIYLYWIPVAVHQCGVDEWIGHRVEYWKEQTWRTEGYDLLIHRQNHSSKSEISVKSFIPKYFT